MSCDTSDTDDTGDTGDIASYTDFFNSIPDDTDFFDYNFPIEDYSPIGISEIDLYSQSLNQESTSNNQNTNQESTSNDQNTNQESSSNDQNTNQESSSNDQNTNQESSSNDQNTNQESTFIGQNSLQESLLHCQNSHQEFLLHYQNSHQESLLHCQNSHQLGSVVSVNPKYRNPSINTPKQFKEIISIYISNIYKMIGKNKNIVKGKCLMKLHNKIVRAKHQDIEPAPKSMAHRSSEYYKIFLKHANVIVETLSENLIEAFRIIKPLN